jgi:predicted ABC-type ATPase
VRQQGHHVPDDVVQRRYQRGLWNFFHLYRPLATTWKVYNNASENGPSVVATGTQEGGEQVVLPDVWTRIKAEVGNV